jgi:hypothetical protein
MKNKIVKPNIKDLEKAFNNDMDLMLFYLTWIKCGLNASKAYGELHPNVNSHSARILGSRVLAKIDKHLVMQAYGLDHQKYFQQLADGLEAIKSDATGQVYPDHKVRRDYHKTLGTLLGIETVGPTIAQQFNLQKGGSLYVIRGTESDEEFTSLNTESDKDIQEQ